MSIESIREILNGRGLVSIAPDATLEAANELMLEGRVTAMPVVEEGELVGIINERDILRHVSQFGGFATTRVADAMTRNVVSIETRCSIVDAVARMQAGGFRHLPVTEMGGKVVGMLTLDDIPFEYKTMRASYVAWRGSMAAS